MRGASVADREHVITAFGNYASVRSRDWNYQTPWVQNNWDAMPEHQRRLSPPELYDLSVDPYELSNAVEGHPEVAATYHEILVKHIQENRSITGGSLEVGDSAFHEVPLFDQSQL
ncbi:MAG: hypothetical protein CME25_02375 [Gemmatimonadetes bacterium]|nr:hypothetical protein [Gemmatimonadota bacterium]